jgi:uncharacterized repeat protein (TIGR01451 family)
MTIWLLLLLQRSRPRTTAAAALGFIGLAIVGCAHPQGLVERSSTLNGVSATLRAQSVDDRGGANVGVARIGRLNAISLPYKGRGELRSSSTNNFDREEGGVLVDVRHTHSIQPVSHEQTTIAGGEPCPPQFYPAYPRAGAAYPGECPTCPPAQPCPVIVNGPGVMAWDPTVYTDEYLCDGGDRGTPFHYEGPRIGGLETEDTIAEAYDITGKRMVVPSSQVCIYAPRFGALRTISGLATELDIQQATGAHDGRRLAGINTRLNIDEQTQRDQLLQFDVRSRPSSMDTESRDSGLHGGTVAGLHQQQMAAYQNLNTTRESQFQQSDLAVLAYGLQAAAAWTRDENPIIYAHDAHGHELEVEFNASEYVGTEDKRRPGLLKVVKLADKEIARPGDEITFTLRFTNSGQRELFGVKIVDNLTPRLTYIDGSADSQVAGALDIEPNGEGSSILTFRLEEPLQGGTSGEITFRCRVR